MGSQWSFMGFWQEKPKWAQTVGELRGTGRASQTAAAQREPVLWKAHMLLLVRTPKLITSPVPPQRTQTTPAMAPPHGRRHPVHALLKSPHRQVYHLCFPTLTSSPTWNTWMGIKQLSPWPSKSKADFAFLSWSKF